MKRSFDEEDFLRRSANIIIHSKGKTFADLTEEIETLRQEFKGTRAASARKFIRQILSRRLFMVALDTSQPPDVVDRLYRRNVREGFVDPAGQLASAFEYAYYCNEQGTPKKGLRVLHKVRKAISAFDEIPRAVLPNFLKAIDTCLRRLKS